MRKRLIVVVAVLLAAAAVACGYYPPVRLFALYAAGRSPNCPLKTAIQCASHIDALRAAKDRILAGSKRIQADSAGFRLFATPKGNWWIPAGNEFVLPFNLAEQELDIYGVTN